MDRREGALRAVRDCVGVKAGETVLIVTDIHRPEGVAQALFQACREQGADAAVLTFDGTLADGQVPPAVDGAMARADAVFCVTTNTLGYSLAAKACVQRGGRVVTMTEAPEDLLTNPGFQADFPALRGTVEQVMAAFDRAGQVRVTAPGGTDLTFSIEGRTSHCCLGTCLEAGMAAVPDMEAYIAPIEGSAQGVLAADVSGTGLGLLKEPIRIEIRDGRAVTFQGGEQARYQEQRVKSAVGGDVLAEFAIGLNPCAKPVGSIVIDEGVYGTGHFALGSNTGFGGCNICGQHLDMVYWKPTIWLDGTVFMKDGILV